MSRSGIATVLLAGGAMCAPFTAYANDEKPAEDSASVADIVVTARRRSEALTDVPVSVTVLGGDSLQSRGVTRFDTLVQQAPAIKASPTGGHRANSQYEIRGIASTESLITEDPAVGIYVDEVYRSRGTGVNQSLFDIENVQVLYGPQGTLFGRNSSTGAILITTKKPSDRLEGDFSATVGNYNAYQLNAAINVPINDRLAIRIAGQRTKRDGYGTNLTTGNKLADQNSYGGRVSIKYQPTDAITNLLIASAYVANEAGSMVILYGYRPCPGVPGVARVPAASCRPDLASGLATAFAQQKADGPYKAAYDPVLLDYRSGTAVNNPDPYERSRNYAVTNTTSIELSDNITLKNIFGYNRVTFEATVDTDGSPLTIIQNYTRTKTSQFTNELQLQGKSGSLDWVLGGLYYLERGSDTNNSIQLVSSLTSGTLRGVNRSMGAFAQGTYHFTDHFSATLGGRYTWDKRKVAFDGYRSAVLPATPVCTFVPALTDPTTCFVERSAKFSQPSYTASLEYKPDANTLFYLAHRRGYRSGGFNSRVTGTVSGLRSYDPEIVRDVELGFKGNFRFGNGGFVRPSLAVYKAWYDGIQKRTNVLTGLAAPVSVSITTNAAEAVVKGTEVSLAISPVRGMVFDGFVGYVDGKYTNFVNGAAVLPDFSFFTSKYTAGLTTTLTPIDQKGFGALKFTANYSYRSPYYGELSLPVKEPESRVPAQHLINLSVDWNDVLDSKFSLSAWVRNATNEVQYAGLLAVSSTLGITEGVVGEPRMFGGTVRYHF